MNNQIMTNTVDELSHYFTGQLKCLKCRKLVSFANDLLTQHLRNCYQKNSEPLVDSNDSYNSQIINQFRAYLKSYSGGLLPDITNAPSSINAEGLKELKILVKQFRCLFCNISGNIEEWGKHAFECYRASGSALWCTCLLCETLIFGEQKIVIDHVHFKKDPSFFSLSHFPGIVDVLKNKLTNYYNFERKVLRDDVKLKLYCGACDWYLLQGVDEHFSTAEHRLNANVIYDLFYCSSCYVIIYGDDRLFHSHTMSKQHVMMKFRNKQELPVKPENIKHRILLMTVKAVMDKNLSENPPAHTYYCDLCSVVASTVNDWSQHVSTNDHKKMMHRETIRVANDDIKPFEYICVHCKLSIVGTIFTQIMHCTSFGHETIKNLRISHQNRATIRAAKETEALRNILIATVSESRNNRQIDGNSARTTESIASTSQNQLGTSQAIKVDQTYRKKESSLPGTTLIYEKDLDTKNELDMVEKLRSFLLETWNKLNVQQCKTNCVYCNDFSSNDSKWWTHLSSQPHIDRMRQHYTTTKSSQAIVLFCHCCNISILGPPSIEKKHPNRAQHIKKSQQFVQCASHFDRTLKGSESSNDVEFKQISKDVISNGIIFENTTSQSTETFRTKDELFDDPGLFKKNDVKLFRTQSISSNASSKNDNDDKSEDEGDVVSYVLLNGEENEEEKVSDHDLDDSFSSENEINSIDVASTSKSVDPTTSQEFNADDGSTEFVKHLIIAKGIPPQIIQNKRICLETFRKYGLIKRIFTKKSKPDWLYLMVLTEPEEVFNRLHQNIKTLKVTLGTDELSIEYDTRNTDQTGIKKNLTNNVKDIFSNLNLLNKEVQNLMRLYDEESNSAESISKIKKLEYTVLDLARNCYGPDIRVRVFTFGSRVTGLATKNSDVDIYLQIDNSFGGGVHENVALQQQLVLYFSNKMRQFPNDFRNIVSIPFARVPIVKFTHSKSNLNCDLSFKSGLSTMNSLLVKTYLGLDDRIRYLVCAVKLWMKENDLADRNLFTTYAQIWMVLFFLMQPEHAVVPTVLNLRNEILPQDRNVIVEGWNCAFPDIRDIVWKSSCPLSKEELLFKFFQFYSQENLQNYVMCTLTGLKMPKKFFHEMYHTLPQSTFDEYKRKLKRDGALYYKVVDDFKGLCIQDPFDHCHNLTKTIGLRKFLCFINLCRQTVDIMKSSLNT